VEISIRKATHDDLDWLLSQMKKFSDLYGTKLKLHTEDHGRASMADMVENHLVLVAEREDGAMLGMISGYVMRHPFNPGITVLSETFWWVAEEYRKTRAAVMLLNAFNSWGKANVNWITMCLIGDSDVSDRSLVKRGFKRQEVSYLLEVE